MSEARDTNRTSTGRYAGTGALLRLALRRDRLVIPLSVLGLVALAGGGAKSTLDLYQGQQAVDAAKALLASPAIVGMYGPIANPDNPDSFAIFKTLLMGAVCVALLAIVLVRRHTRTEEEAGRTELVGAGAVGRRAPLTAAVLLAAATVLLTSVLAALSLIGAGLGTRGSLAFGAAWAASGLTFTGVTAVAAQLTTTTRGCGAWAFGTLASPTCSARSATRPAAERPP
jgi:ABC-2 type transport system permease protein